VFFCYRALLRKTCHIWPSRGACSSKRNSTFPKANAAAYLLFHVLQSVVAECCCSVLQCVAVCCSVLQCFAVCCSVLQCVFQKARQCLVHAPIDWGASWVLEALEQVRCERMRSRSCRGSGRKLVVNVRLRRGYRGHMFTLHFLFAVEASFMFWKVVHTRMECSFAMKTLVLIEAGIERMHTRPYTYIYVYDCIWTCMCKYVHVYSYIYICVYVYN